MADKSKLTKNDKPDNIKVTMYNVGFGDCFLLTFIYTGKKNFHILIDCGSTSKKKKHMEKVVDQITKDCKGKLDAVVVTHRHKDHLSAFGLKGLDKKLKQLKPDLVIQPWTEHPLAKEEAIEPPGIFEDSPGLSLIKSFINAQSFAERIVRNPNKIVGGAGAKIKKQILNIAELSVKNKAAVKCLQEISDQRAYVHSGSKSGLEKILPGVKVYVLGPPTVKQTESIKKQTAWDEDEFWKLRIKLADANVSNVATAKGDSFLFNDADTATLSGAPTYTKWIIKELDNIQSKNVKQIVTMLDDALNNTSVVLLFKTGKHALLFPGDAQLENWQYALDDPKLKKELKKVTLYKVGHHGSTNATPKSLWNLFLNKGSKKNLVSLLSTAANHHSGVPRKSLVEELETNSTLINTQKIKNKIKIEYDI